jgi:putative hemolysin
MGKVKELFTEIFFLTLLIILNAFFSATEIALISLNDKKIKLMAEKGNKKAKLLENLLKEPAGYLATIQIGITFAGFLASAFAAESFSKRLSELIKFMGVPIADKWLNNISIVIITILLSYFSLVLGELVPKRLAMKIAEPISMFAARPLSFLSHIMFPFIKILTQSTNFFVRLLGFDPYENDKQVTEEEIRMMVDIGEQKGTIHETEKEMINNIFEFDNKLVSDIMTHRTDIAALPIGSRLDEVITFINVEKYSRIPVYEENIDNIIGVMYSKDLIKYLSEKNGKERFSLKKVVRPPYFVPESKRIDELFKELQHSKIHLTIIIDEYGGTAGIVSLEDLIEEIVGNIFDEDDIVEIDIEKLNENTFIINGSTSLDVVKDYFKVKLPIEDYETLSGFIIGQLGRIPKKDEKSIVKFNGIVFKVEEIEEKKIAKVRVLKT